MTLPPWEYLFLSFNSRNFPDLFRPTWVAALVLLGALVVLYNLRTRALHRHPPYLDMWEWLLWTGVIVFSLLIVFSLFVWDFLFVLVTLIGGAAVFVDPLRPLPADLRGLRTEDGEGAVLHPLQVLAP